MKIVIKNVMMTAVLALTAFTGAIAHAEVKPANELIPHLCGNLNRSVQICTATAGGRDFITRQIFPEQMTYIIAKKKALNPGVAGIGAFEYSGEFVEKVDGQIFVRKYVLEVRTTMHPYGLTHASLSINGGHPRSFQMELVATTQSVN